MEPRFLDHNRPAVLMLPQLRTIARQADNKVHGSNLRSPFNRFKATNKFVNP